jgi:hypothetical protein
MREGRQLLSMLDAPPQPSRGRRKTSGRQDDQSDAEARDEEDDEPDQTGDRQRLGAPHHMNRIITQLDNPYSTRTAFS